MVSMNRVLLMGRVGKDPDIRTLQNGTQIVNFSLATKESWTDKATGEKKEETEWHNIAVFNPAIVAKINGTLKKGDHVCIEGQLKKRKYTDKQGLEKESVEILLSKFSGRLWWASLPASQKNNSGAAFLEDDEYPF